MINLNKKDPVADAVKDILQQEALKGNQDKIDANHNGKIDGQDFKILRAKKKMQEEESGRTEDCLDGKPKAKKGDDVGPGSNGKSSKVKLKSEEVEELDEKNWIAGAIKHPGALKKQLHVKADEKIPAGKLEKASHASGKLGKRARLAMTLKGLKEKFEEPVLDELINEVLSKDASAGDWIHDFVHSDNPKFAGKSKAKRKEMALAAYYSKKNEEVELEEGLGDKLKEVGKKALEKLGHGSDEDMRKDLQKKAGLPQTGKKPTSEEVEQIEELSKGTLSSYLTKKKSEFMKGKTQPGTKEYNKDVQSMGKAHDKMKEEVELDEEEFDRYGSHSSAVALKLDRVKRARQMMKDEEGQKKPAQPKPAQPTQTEEVEQIDELSKSTLGSYVKKAARDMSASRKIATDFEHREKRSKKPSMKAAASSLSDKFNRYARKRNTGIGQAVERLTKEETVEEGWDDMVKSAKDAVKSGPKPSGGSGVKQGSRYGGGKQKDKPEHDDDKVKNESKRPDTDTVPFVTDEAKPMTHAKYLAKKSLKRMRTEMLGKISN